MTMGLFGKTKEKDPKEMVRAVIKRSHHLLMLFSCQIGERMAICSAQRAARTG